MGSDLRDLRLSRTRPKNHTLAPGAPVPPDNIRKELAIRTSLRPLTSVALALTAAIVFGTVWFLWTGPAPLGAACLPDGTVLRLEAVTYGSRHRFDLRRDWQRLLAPLLLPRLPSRMAPTGVEYLSSSPAAAVFWVRTDGRPPSSSFLRTEAYDDRGDTVEVDDVVRRASTLLPQTSQWVGARELSVFPRRGAWLGLRLYGPGDDTPVADFRVRNPAPGPYPSCRAESLPQTRREGSLSFTLTRLSTGPLPNGRREGTRASFRVSENGRVTRRWEPIGMTLSDATGNLLEPAGMQTTSTHGEAQLWVPANLPLSEAAWKVRAEFVPMAEFSSADLLTVPDVAVPIDSRPVFLSLKVNKHGLHREIRFELEPLPKPAGQLCVQMREDQPMAGGRVALLRATDERGRSWTPLNRGRDAYFSSRGLLAPGSLQFLPSRGSFGSRGEAWGGYPLPLPPNVRRVSLTFAVVKSRFVEFRARPVRH